GIRYQVSGIKYQVSSIRYQVSGIKYQVNVYSHRIPDPHVCTTLTSHESRVTILVSRTKLASPPAGI
ncbi:MAG TPA: hypothetical protein PKE14_13495, partial [Chitinophagales bacterium]|nr:hypothetical protein [Chitinophagales bacterium]